jgi:hypothetical protein
LLLSLGKASVYTSCVNHHRGLQYFSESYGSGQLRAITEELFNLFSEGHSVVVDSLQWKLRNYKICIQYFVQCSGFKLFKQIYELAEQTRTDCSRRLINLQKMDPELVKMVLLRATCRLFSMIKNETGDISRSIQCSMATLTAVSKKWRDALSDARTKSKSLFQQYLKCAKLLSSLHDPRYELHTHLDVDGGLLDDLETRNVLSNECIEEIRKKATIQQRFRELLSCITVTNVGQFIEALNNTEQSHLVEFISKQGDLRVIIPSKWPVTACKSKVDLLHRHRSELLSVLDSESGLLEITLELGLPELPTQRTY